MKLSCTLVLTLGVIVGAFAVPDEEGPAQPATEAPKPAPATEAPKPAPDTEAPKPAPATEAPKPAPATEAPKPAPAPGSCDSTAKPPGKLYKDSQSGKGLLGAWNCMNYYECSSGTEIKHQCFYFIPLRQYNPSTRSCEWFWKVNCHDDDPTN